MPAFQENIASTSSRVEVNFNLDDKDTVLP